MDGGYKLSELAERAGVSPRTVRYYVQRGLLPPPVFKGRDTAYGEEHLARLRAIRALQDEHLPLDSIQAELEHRPHVPGSRTVARDPHPPPRPSPSRHAAPRSRRLTDYELADGLTLTVADDAPRSSQALLSELLAIAENRRAKGNGP
jgi:DNA-binding transcriptional MerR regulator